MVTVSKKRLVGCLESSVTLYLRHSCHSCVKKIRRRPCYACIFSPCSDDCGCEKFVTELPAQPTSQWFGPSAGILVTANARSLRGRSLCSENAPWRGRFYDHLRRIVIHTQRKWSIKTHRQGAFAVAEVLPRRLLARTIHEIDGISLDL